VPFRSFSAQRLIGLKPYRNLGIILSFTIFFLFTYLLGTEYISAAHSKGELLVFKRGHIPAVSKSHDDEESSPPSEASRVVAENTEHEKTEHANGIFKQTAIFHWRDVCYDIKIKGQPKRLLDHVDGWIQPGTLTALMVSSLN
jgi:ATP-binding cassette subfamily G (WHITE) protein 2 (PDR)